MPWDLFSHWIAHSINEEMTPVPTTHAQCDVWSLFFKCSLEFWESNSFLVIFTKISLIIFCRKISMGIFLPIAKYVLVLWQQFWDCAEGVKDFLSRKISREPAFPHQLSKLSSTEGPLSLLSSYLTWNCGNISIKTSLNTLQIHIILLHCNQRSSFKIAKSITHLHHCFIPCTM